MLGMKRIRKNKAKPRKKPSVGMPFHILVAGLKLGLALGGIVCLSLSFIFVYDVVTQCDFFESRQVHIIGTERLSKQQVLSQAGIESNMNILALNLHLARKRLMGHPWIAEARVTRELPDTLFIWIREHEPLAVMDLGEKYVINTDGEIFKKWAGSDPENLPLITGLSFADIRLADEDKGSPAFDALMAALLIGREERSVMPNRLVRRIHVDTDLGLTLYAFGEEKAIKLGYRNFREKFRYLKTLLYRLNQQPDWTGFDAIDLANLNRVIVVPTKGGWSAGKTEEGVSAGT